MEDASDTPSLSSSAVLEVASKIIIAAVIVLFIVIALVALVHIYARVFWWSSSGESPSILHWRRQQAAARQQRGLDRSTLDSLPVVIYNPEDFKEVGGLECAVCICELEKGEKARLLPKCNHGFHLDCIDMWLQSHSSCPICRDSVVGDPEGSVDSDSSGSAAVAVEAGNGLVNSTDEIDDQNQHGGEPVAFPTNVLFWGDEISVARSTAAEQDVVVASTSGNTSSSNNGVLVIDVQVPPLPEMCEDCCSSAEEAKSPPVVLSGRFRTLKRLLSGRGNRVGTSSDAHQQQV